MVEDIQVEIMTDGVKNYIEKFECHTDPSTLGTRWGNGGLPPLNYMQMQGPYY